MADPTNRSLLKAVSRGNVAEAVANYARNDRSPELYVDPFMDLRQTIMGIGDFIDKGTNWCVIQDQQHEQCAINLRVSSSSFHLAHHLYQSSL